MTKPFIQFGVSDIIDSNFYKFHISENLHKFNEKHFSNSPELIILPHIDNNDTTLTFILEYDKIPINLQHSNYLRLHINEYSFWRITSKNKIFSGDRLFIKFNCKRDIITEYFVFKKHSLTELPLLYVIRSTFIKPTLENLKICSNACVSDNEFKLEKTEIVDVDTGNKIDGIFYEFKTVSIGIINDIVKELNKFYFYFQNKIKSFIDNHTSNWNLYKNVIVGNTLKVDINDFVRQTGTISSWRKYGTAKPGGEWWDSNKEGYLRNKKPFFYKEVLQNPVSLANGDGLYVKSDGYSLLSLKALRSYINDVKEKDNRFNAKNLITTTKKPIIGRNSLIKLWDVSDGEIRNSAGIPSFMFYYTFQQDDGNDENPFYRIPFHYYLYTKNYNAIFSNWIPREYLIFYNGLKDYKDEYAFYTIFRDRDPTLIGGRKQSFIFELNKKIDSIKDIIKDYGLKDYEKHILNSYDESINDWIAYIGSKFNIEIIKLNKLTGTYFKYGDKINGGVFPLEINDDGDGTLYKTSNNYVINLIEFKFIKEVSQELKRNIIYNGKIPQDHYEASHMKHFIYGNKVGVFKVKPELTYYQYNVDAKAKVIFSKELGFLNEMGNINENYDNLGQITNKRLILETNAEKFRLNNIYNKTLLDNKINNMRKQNDFQKSVNRTQKTNNIIKTIGSTGITAGLSGTFGTGGALAGNIINNALWNNIDTNINEYILDYKTNQEILNLQQDHKLNTQLQGDMYNIETFSDLAVSAFLTNTSDNKFPWLDQEHIYYSLVLIGDLDKIREERLEYGNFINNYHKIETDKLAKWNFLMIDAAKSFNIELPNLTQLEIELLKQNLSNGIKFLYEK